MNSDQIKRFWDKQASSEGASRLGCHSDPHLVELENWFIIEKCLRRFSPNKLLDVGCGNGKRTKLLSRYAREETVGIDYSDKMIGLARKLENRKLHFSCDDILDLNHLKAAYNRFDCIISCRCLINLGSTKNQRQAIANVHKLLNRNGLFVLCEGSMRGTIELNSLRLMLGLNPITPIPANLDIEEAVILPWIHRKFRIINSANFGWYYLLTRAYYPALVFPKDPNPRSKWNKLAARLVIKMDEDYPRFGRHLCLLLQKKN